MAYGFVYILNNDIMPEIYKIGFTEKSPLQRCSELSSKTAVPIPYSVVCYGEVFDPQSLENKLHNLWADNRVNNNREFFILSNEEVFNIGLGLKECCDNFVECQEFKIIKNLIVYKDEK